MNFEESSALEQLRADLRPNEKIYVFGPGGEKNTNKVPALKKFLGFTVFAVAAGTIGWLAPLPSEIHLFLGILPIVLFAFGFWVVAVEFVNDKDTEDSFYALTNQRLLLLDNRLVKTVAKRSEIKKMQSTERTMSLFFNARVLLIKKLRTDEA